jgi:hypothetical protein
MLKIGQKVKCLHNILQNNNPVISKHEIVTVTNFRYIDDGFEYIAILTNSGIELDCLLSSFSEDLDCIEEQPDINLQEYEDKVAAKVLNDIFNYTKEFKGVNLIRTPYVTYIDSCGNIQLF